VGGIRLASKTKRSSLPSTSSPLVANFTDIPNIQNQVELDRSIPTTSNPSQNKAIPLSPLIHPGNEIYTIKKKVCKLDNEMVLCDDHRKRRYNRALGS
jgi:hypothetical protein